MKPAVLSPKARQDLNEAARWIAKDNLSAARALRNAVHRKLRKFWESLLRLDPNVWKLLHQNTGILPFLDFLTSLFRDGVEVVGVVSEFWTFPARVS